jgi:hypothetical protein
MAEMMILAATNVPAMAASIARKVSTHDLVPLAALRRFHRLPISFDRISEARRRCFDRAQVTEFSYRAV